MESTKHKILLNRKSDLEKSGLEMGEILMVPALVTLLCSSIWQISAINFNTPVMKEAKESMKEKIPLLLSKEIPPNLSKKENNNCFNSLFTK